MGMLDGKVIIVTGAGNGIGRASALTLAREGARVSLADIDAEAGDLTAKMIDEEGGAALFVRTDVSDRDAVLEFMGLTMREFHRLDGAFNNAGIEGERAPIHMCTEDNWQRVLNVNLSSVFRCMKVEIPALLQTGGGSIVNNSSVAGLVGFPGIPAYATSKHGIIGLTKAAALDLAKFDIRVNAVCPGVIDTDMISRFTHGDDNALQAMRSMEPMGRLGKPEEVAELVAWLLSDRSSFVTGQAIADDGGFVAQ